MHTIELPSGEIQDMTVPWLFQGLRTQKRTGAMLFERDEAIKKVFFSAGDVVYASSNQPTDRLSEWLVRAGIITREQSDRVTEEYHKTKKREGVLLTELGILKPEELVDGIKYQTKQIIISLFNWRDGAYTFEEGRVPAADIIPLRMSTGNLIIEGFHGLEWQVVRKSLPSLRTILRPSDDPSLLFQGASLDEDHRAVLALIDGNKSIEELCAQTSIGDFNTLKAIYVLLAIRMVEKGELKTEEEKKFVREAVHETIAVKEEKVAERKVARIITREELLVAYANLGTLNHYELLNVGRTALPQEIKKAYFALAMLYHPDRHFIPEMSDMKEKLEALFTAIHDAYETLSNKAKREEYDLYLASGAERQRAVERARTGQQDERETAVVQFNEGLKQYKTGNFWGAEEAFRWAIRLDPEKADYVFHRAMTLARMPRRGNDAEEAFVRAIKMAPKKMDYYLSLGAFYEKYGLKAKAISLYQDALKHDPNAEKIKQALKKISG